MTRPDTNEQARMHRMRAASIVIGAVAVLTACLVLTAATSPAAATGAPVVAQENNTTVPNSEYYNGSSSVQNESWFAGIEDATLDSLGRMATRATTYFIGTGSMDSSGTGFQGVLLTGIIMGVSLLGAVAGLGIGTVGGSVIAVVIGFGMTELGLAPAWFRILLLFAIGIIAYVALSGVMEGR